MEAGILEIPGCKLCSACAKGYDSCPTTAPSTTSVDKAESQSNLFYSSPYLLLVHNIVLYFITILNLISLATSTMLYAVWK